MSGKSWQHVMIAEDKFMCGFSQEEREWLPGNSNTYLMDTFKNRKSGKRMRRNIQRGKRKHPWFLLTLLREERK